MKKFFSLTLTLTAIAESMAARVKVNEKNFFIREPPVLLQRER